MAEKRRETTEDVQAAKAEAKALFGLNKDDLFDRILRKQAGIEDDPTNGPSGLVDPSQHRRAKMLEITGKADGPEDHHMNWDGFLSQVPAGVSVKGKKQASSTPRGSFQSPHTISLAIENRLNERFQPILNELNRFKFASDATKRNAQFKEILSSVKVAMQKMACREVIDNTRGAYDNAVKFFLPEAGGVRVVFKVASADAYISVSANGPFNGEEVICLEEHGNNVSPFVIRPGEHGADDYSHQFDIQMKQVANPDIKPQ